MHQSFLTYKNYKYFKLSSILMLISIFLYWYHDPLILPNGGTWLGYTLGSIGAALIILLMWFGIRKRQYSSNLGTVQGWLSAHVYLGLSLIVIATLHAGFQINWNVHTLAYVLMLVVILSGFYGVYVYIRFPPLMTGNQSRKTREMMFEELDDIETALLKKSKLLNSRAHNIILEIINSAVVGGKVSKQIKIADQFVLAKDKKELIATTQAKLMSISDDGETSHVSEVSDLLKLITRHNKILIQVDADVTYKSIMEFWLYIHVPITFALLATLITHVVVVFFYW